MTSQSVIADSDVWQTAIALNKFQDCFGYLMR